LASAFVLFTSFACAWVLPLPEVLEATEDFDVRPVLLVAAEPVPCDRAALFRCPFRIDPLKSVEFAIAVLHAPSRLTAERTPPLHGRPQCGRVGGI